jgi:tetratricopeptide (TPR) repeat protein
MPISEERSDANTAHWDAVEEATELLHEERYRDALAELRDVIRASPENPYAYYFLGMALYEVGELEPSRDAYRACLHLAPTHLGARVALSHVLRQLGDAKEAIKEGARALTQAPGDGEALHAVGLAYLERGDDTAAKKYLEAFLETHPELEVAAEVRVILVTLDDRLPKES